GIFLALHALGTPGLLFSDDLAGFKIAIPVGLLVSAVFAVGSAFVDARPELGALVTRRRTTLRTSLFVAAGLWFACTVAKLPPAEGAGRRGCPWQLPRRNGDRGDDRLCDLRGPLRKPLPPPAEPFALGRDRLFRAVVGGAGRRCGHRGARVACEL